jgi:O-antigen ligase
MLLFSLFILFATVTRGALIALSVAIVYALFLMRRRLQIVPLTLLIVGSAAAVIGMELYLTTFTNAGSLFARFSDTKFVGYLPDSRAQVWPLAFERFLEHPVIGWGPFYALRIGVRLYTWPHSLPLFIANCFGVVGLACFVYLMWRLWKLSAPDTDWLGHPTYARAYLLIAHIQLVVFFVNEMKIEYLRNPVYQYVVWVFFSMIVAGWKVRQIERQAEARQTRPLARAA